MENKKWSIQEIKQKLQEIQSESDADFQLILADSRKGVQQSIASWRKQQLKKQQLKAKFQEMSIFEQEMHAQGITLVAGVDEVGRGPIAGPVVAAAVILPANVEILELNDSKQLSANKRAFLCKEIEKQAISIGIGIIDEKRIDEINIYEASKEAMLQAIAKLNPAPEGLLIDAMKLPIQLPQQNLIKGDARSVSIAAASIVAKEFRDQLMADYGVTYPGYAFEKNAGYGTKDHLAGLELYGVTPIHRKTFAPVKNKL